ncbi:MAG: T9SS type A sorting domain-containing protein, partial [Bacteroidia bacterium]
MATKFLPVSLLLLSLSASYAQTAQDFTANDCGGISHHLFSELDSGKIIVICFVMPCSSCIGPAQGANTTVQDFATTHPGKVRFYLADDFANTPCGTLVSWANNNGMSGVTSFSNPDVTEAPYGPDGMPKTVVLGGTDHKVHFVENGGLNTTNLKAAINSAILLSSVPEAETKADFQLKVYPNPATDHIFVQYVISESSPLGFEIYNMVGVQVNEVAVEAGTPGEQSFAIGLNGLSEGI